VPRGTKAKDDSMRSVTVEVPDDLAEQLTNAQDRLPELLALGLQQPAAPAPVYRAILTFLASGPSPAEVAAYTPPSDARQRLELLLERSKAELDDFERIEHLMVMLKAGALSALAGAP
jgi:hypothetical protein